VLDAAEALFFEGRDEVAVVEEDGGHVAVVGVDAKDVHTIQRRIRLKSTENVNLLHTRVLP